MWENVHEVFSLCEKNRLQNSIFSVIFLPPLPSPPPTRKKKISICEAWKEMHQSVSRGQLWVGGVSQRRALSFQPCGIFHTVQQSCVTLTSGLKGFMKITF